MCFKQDVFCWKYKKKKSLGNVRYHFICSWLWKNRTFYTCLIVSFTSSVSFFFTFFFIKCSKRPISQFINFNTKHRKTTAISPKGQAYFQIYLTAFFVCFFVHHSPKYYLIFVSFSKFFGTLLLFGLMYYKWDHFQSAIC